MYDISYDYIPDLPQSPYRNGVGAYEGVCMHDTECKGDSDESEVSYFKNNWQSRQAFVHAFMDCDSITVCADVNYKQWGCGNGNSRFVNIELCNGDNFQEAYNRWVWYAGKLLWDRKLGVIDGVTLVSHSWVSKNLGGTNHNDPEPFLLENGKTWADVVNDVTYIYNMYEQQSVEVTPVDKTVKATTSLNVRSLPSTDGAILGQLAQDQQVKVIGEVNGWYQIQFNGKIGYCSAKYCVEVQTWMFYPDIDAEQYAWCKDIIQWAKEKGIISGDANGNFLPDQPATRLQTVIIIHNAMKSAGLI